MKRLLFAALFWLGVVSAPAAISPYVRNVLTTNAYVLGTNLTLTAGVLESATGSAGGGSGTTINPTDGAVPYRYDATTFGDFPLTYETTTTMGFSGQYNYFTTGATYGIGMGYGSSGAANGSYNVAVGYLAMQNNSSGSYNTTVGKQAGAAITDEISNVYVGSVTGGILKGDQNVVIGADTGNVNWRYSGRSVVIGYGKWGTVGVLTNLVDSVDIGGYGFSGGLAPTNTLNGVTNSITLGFNAITHGSRTATIGNTNITVLWVANVGWFQGAGSPEGVITAPVGSMYSRLDGGAGTSFYVHENTGNTNWVAK